MTEHRLDLDSIRDMLGSHSIFAPSSSAMWVNCSGSLIPHIQGVDEAGEEAAEGTVAHAVAEEWLRTGVRPDHLVGEVREVQERTQTFEIEITEEMLDYLEAYFDWCYYLPGVHYIETRVDFSDLTPVERQGGTADHAVIQPRHLIVTDLKYGKGIQVYAFENTQAILYGYGFFREYDDLCDFETITIRICQPRRDHFDEWTITRDELLKWAAHIKERAYAAWCHDAKRTPGLKQCTWCRAKPDCAAYVVFAEKLIDGVFDNLEEIDADAMADVASRIDGGLFTLKPTPVGSLTIEQKAKLLPYRGMIESWFKGIQENLEELANAGADVPYYKLVEGRSNRRWVSPEKAYAHLRSLRVPEDKIYKPRQVISITEAEKALVETGRKRKELPELLAGIVTKPQGKPTLVPITDKRPALTVGKVFGDLDDEL